MDWTPLRCSTDHKGKTLPQIVLSDPDWFFWAVDDDVFENKGVLLRESTEVYDKATHIKIPKANPAEWCVEYAIHPSVGKFVDFEILKKTHPKHVGSTGTFRLDVIDLSAPRKISNYDKQGGRLLIRCLKYYVFGNEKYRLTKNRCEAFFNNDNNFTVTRREKWRKRPSGFFKMEP